MTFSIAARCPRTGMLGVATSSKALAAGGGVPYIETSAGAIASQSFVNPYLGIDGLVLLEQGLSAERALERLIEADPGRDLRQLGIVDKDGRVAAYTGARCIPWAGHVVGGAYVCLGNILAGEEVVKAMARAFEAGEDEELPERLLRALEVGQAAGGDRRGRQSAGLQVVAAEAYPYCDLRVDDHPDPVPELRRVFEVYRREQPFWQMMLPRRDDYIPHWDTVMRVRDQIEESLREQEAGLPAGGLD
ncbi:MAG TPA: DUF1028 domain-containing protein [Dehalococcoidia bacterium]|nr:DUF1028 domain-containing protein [Dehalococcoidia bacterium]